MPSIQPPPAEDEHVILFGDSIFANRAYTHGAPDVISHLRGFLPGGWRATLLALDGATASGLTIQLKQMPADATRLVVAIGGNDALANIDLLSFPASSSAQVLATFATRLAEFEVVYRHAIRQLVSLQRPATICTIYNGALPEHEARLARIGLMMFNDTILRTAFDERLDVIELRAVCHELRDYANPIEPSGAGGRKIALAIATALGVANNRAAPSRVWARPVGEPLPTLP
jgi:hypothetical protein